MVQLEDDRISSARPSSIYYDFALSPYLWQMPQKKKVGYLLYLEQEVFISVHSQKNLFITVYINAIYHSSLL